MLTWQSIAAAVLLVYSPTILFLLFIIWRDGAFSRSSPRPEHPEILTTARKSYCRLASEIRDYASHLNDPLKNQSELASRIQFSGERRRQRNFHRPRKARFPVIRNSLGNTFRDCYDGGA
jgi:hypothetical protein